MDITGSSALVTGGVGGLGAATVRRLAAAGARVVICDVDESKGQALASEVGGGARFVRTDVLSEDAVEQAVAAANETASLRVAVACHGGPAAGGRTLRSDRTPHSLQAFNDTIQSYLVGVFNVLRLSAAAMAGNQPVDDDGQRGVIVNTSSIAGFEGTIGQVAYAAAKGGVMGMTLTAARDLAVVGVRVATIAPGTFFTPAYGAPAEQLEAIWGPAVPFPKRMGRADEFGQLVVQIAENDYLNGEVIRLDGGLRFQPRGASS